MQRPLFPPILDSKVLDEYQGANFGRALFFVPPGAADKVLPTLDAYAKIASSRR